MEEINNLEQIAEETNDDFSNDDLFNITSWGADMNLREIITSYKESDIVKPELQRKYVWDKKSASRFIESILLGLPVPSLFFAKTSDSRMLIVDGYQRIKTICDFFDGIWTGDNSPFQLTNSDRINQRWRNKSYRDLSEEDQRRFKMYTIHAIIFEQKHPQNDSGLYQIFERINTSGMALNAQEIRNCVFQGKMNNLLFSLNDYPVWRELFGDLRPNSRMLDIEFILRFFAISQTEILQSTAHSISLKKVLNDYMSAYISGEDSFFEAKGEEFKRCIDFLNDKFGKDVFYNLQGSDFSVIRRKFYPTVYDSIMIATKIALERGFDTDENLEPKRLMMLKDSRYRECITQGTMQVEHIKDRVAIALSMLYGLNISDE